MWKKRKKLIINDWQIVISEVADDIGISAGSCHEIFSEVLGMLNLKTRYLLIHYFNVRRKQYDFYLS